MKKGEMSMNMIIMAVIAIIILVIIIFLVTRSSGDANTATACASKGGVCKQDCDAQNVITDETKPIRCPETNNGFQQQCCTILG
ncbi:MAG: hypothetical protein ACP5N2_06795 [Candidatus Nanoarchaeia archaeon]